MTYAVCIDTGGTFTDCVVAAGDELRIFKTPSTPPEFDRGFMNALALAADDAGLGLDRFLNEVDVIIHGTTASTNALVEGKTARVGLIVNAGHPDILTLRDAPEKRSFDWHLDYPEPFVARNLTAEVGGRFDSGGRELEPLNETDVRTAADRFRRLEVEAVAVCLLWSIINGAHERRVAEILRDELPGLPITLSHELNPVSREYRRAISAAINAALAPVISRYVGSIENSLRQAGYCNDLLIANCVGGMMQADEIVERPIYSVMSGPTLAPVAARRLTDEPDVIVIDMGGTTLDVSAIRDHEIVISPEAMLTRYDLLGLPKVDVRSVGAGGGSIAWVDPGGLLHVGPHSAGARPGPACYGAGGTDATVTDANVVLGIIDPDFFLGGRIALDRAAAEAAVGTVGARLGTGLLETAHAIHAASNHTMIAAIEDITVGEGLDPRECYLVAGGGATGAHLCEMADILGITRAMIPRFVAGLSAFGGLVSEFRSEAAATLAMTGERFDADAVNRVLAELTAKGAAFLERAGVAHEDRRYDHLFSARYRFQSWEIDVPFTPGPDGLGAGDVTGLVAGFHAMHQRIYTIHNPDESVEFTAWKVRAVGAGRCSVERGAPLSPAPTGAVEPKGRREVYRHDAGATALLPVFDADRLSPGMHIDGPAIAEAELTTILLHPGWVADIDAHGNFLLTKDEP
jgi:N-methylhydantoinase A